MSLRSAAIALASLSSGLPPPKRVAASAEMNDQVTASSRPRAASARFTSRRRFCIVVSMRGATPVSRGSGSSGTLSTPSMRITSSTRSAFCVTSGRNDGTVTVSTGALRETPNPSRVSSSAIRAGARARPVSRRTSLTGNSITVPAASTWPATTISCGVPPHISRISRVASSRPGTWLSGSTVRSKR